MRTCIKCKRELPLSDFHKSSRTKDGLQKNCRDCNTQYQREWRARNGPANKKKWAKMGLTPEDVETLKLQQEGKCLICKRKRRRLVVDHCHKTGKFRGMVCHNCNVAMGLFSDNVKIMRAAIRYLQKAGN